MEDLLNILKDYISKRQQGIIDEPPKKVKPSKPQEDDEEEPSDKIQIDQIPKLESQILKKSRKDDPSKKFIFSEIPMVKNTQHLGFRVHQDVKDP